MTFAEGAGRLAGVAGALLGWRPDEFWRATPAEVAAVFEALAGDGAAGANGEELARLMGLFPDAAPREGSISPPVTPAQAGVSSG